MKGILALLIFAAIPAARAQTTGDAAYAVLQAKCVACHDSKLRSGKLLMESVADLLRGGTHGPAVVPGRSRESLLVRRVTGEQQPKMPLEGELGRDEIDTLRRWIDAGAPAWSSASTAPAPLDLPDVKPTVPVEPAVNALAWSPDGKTFAAARHREIRLIDGGTLAVARRLAGATDVLRAVAWSPDGKLVAGAGGGPSRYGEIVVWDAASGEVVRTIRGHRDYVYALAWSPDGKTLASSSYDRLIKLWDASSGAELRTLKEHTDAVFPLAFSPDGKRLASGGADRTVKLWDVASGKRLYTLGESTDVVTALAFHPSGQKLSASGADKQIRTWKLEADSGTLVQSIIAHEAEVTRIAYLPDGDHLVSASADHTVKLWDMRRGEVARSFPAQSDWVLGLAVSPDGTRLAVGRYDGSVETYSLTERMRSANSDHEER